jgi:hypothetical protein
MAGISLIEGNQADALMRQFYVGMAYSENPSERYGLQSEIRILFFDGFQLRKCLGFLQAALFFFDLILINGLLGILGNMRIGRIISLSSCSRMWQCQT